MNTTANCLIELGTEELPPKALKALSTAFEEGLLAGLRAADLTFNADNVKSFATPRRLAIVISDLQTQQPDKNIEKLGPAVAAAYDKEGKPSKAAEGFARSNGIAFDDLVKIDTDKGERLGFRSVAKGKATAELLEGLIASAVLEAIVKMLTTRFIIIVLSRTPIVVISKTANCSLI